MDTVEHYRMLIQQALTEYAQIPFSIGEIQTQTVFDHDNDRYLLMLVGWEGVKRVHGCLVHLDIINDKIWIQRDGTEEGIATGLMAAGVPKHHIVLGFRSLQARKLSEFAAE